MFGAGGIIRASFCVKQLPTNMTYSALRPLCSIALVIGLITNAQAQGLSLSSNGAAPNANAILDLNVAGFTAKRGLLIPRMTASDRTSITGPADGLWVFQTNSITNAPSGLWYYDATASSWVRQATGEGWKVTGDVWTTGYYAGTSDAYDFVLSTNSTPRVTISSGGNMGINVAAPAEKLDVDGAIHLDPSGVSSLGNTQGTIRWNPTDSVLEGNLTGTAAGWKQLQNAFNEVNNQPYQGVTQTCGNGNIVTTQYGSQAIAQSSGNLDTPFPTAVARAWKVQHIFTAAELLNDIGLCPGNITEICFGAVQDDNSGALYNMRLGLRHTTQTQFFGGTPNWVTGVTQNAALNGAAVRSGWFCFTLTGAGFNWNGTDNIVVELTASGSNAIGISPAVQMIANVGARRTRMGYMDFPINGWALNDNPLNPSTLGSAGAPFNTALFSTFYRPVLRLTGRALGPVPVAATDDYLLYEGGIMVGDGASAGVTWAAGAYNGPGFVHAQNGVYDGSLQLSDHVFDQYYDGRYAEEDIEKALTYEWKDLDELKTYLQENRHLPNLPSREEWEAYGSSSLGEISTGIWQAVEQQALYISELEADLHMLELLAYEDGLSDTQLAEMLDKVERNPRLSAVQKTSIIKALSEKNAELRAGNSK